MKHTQRNSLVSVHSLCGIRPSRRLFRALRGPYSQEELARAIGTEQSSVSAWESRTAHPSPRYLRKLFAHYRAWTGELGFDPLNLFPPPRRPRAPRAPTIQPIGTPAAPSSTAGKRKAAAAAAPSEPAAPSTPEGAAE